MALPNFPFCLLLKEYTTMKEVRERKRRVPITFSFFSANLEVTE